MFTFEYNTTMNDPGLNTFCINNDGQYDDRGVDLMLLRWMLTLTPNQRLLEMERQARDQLKLLKYGEQHRQIKTRKNTDLSKAE
jgi:hypothetical protein